MSGIESQQVRPLDSSLSKAIGRTINKYLSVPNNKNLIDLYKLVIEEIEAPLYKAVMEHCRYNQCRAAILLGVSRVTCRKKLKYYFDGHYNRNT